MIRLTAAGPLACIGKHLPCNSRMVYGKQRAGRKRTATSTCGWEDCGLGKRLLLRFDGAADAGSVRHVFSLQVIVKYRANNV